MLKMCVCVCVCACARACVCISFQCSIWLLCKDNNPHTMGSDLIKTSYTASVILQYFLLHAVYKHSHIMSNKTVIVSHKVLVFPITDLFRKVATADGNELQYYWGYYTWYYKGAHYFLTAYYRWWRWLKIFPSKVWSHALVHISWCYHGH